MIENAHAACVFADEKHNCKIHRFFRSKAECDKICPQYIPCEHICAANKTRNKVKIRQDTDGYVVGVLALGEGLEATVIEQRIDYCPYCGTRLSQKIGVMHRR